MAKAKTIFKKLCIVIFATTLFSATCNKNQNSIIASGKIVKESVDGCTWLIKLDNEKLLQPINLSSFNVTVKDGQRVDFTYQIDTTTQSICMMGTIIHLLIISDK